MQKGTIAMNIPGFKDITTLHRGRRLTSLRACRNDGLQWVILRIPNHQAHYHLLESGYTIGRRLDPEQVVRPLALEFQNAMGFMVLEDFGAQPLAGTDMAASSLEAKIDLFVQITRAVASIHDAGFIHHDLNPDNIWIHPETGRVKIDGMCLASRADRTDRPDFKNDLDLFRFEYTSPEQTGRTRIATDRTTDLYALGCIFYEIAVGRPPFFDSPPIELIYRHLASTPRWPHQMNPAVPESVSGIIMKLLEKNPRNRYQTCIDLQNDLERCLNRGKEPLPTRWPLGAVPSGRLYGRDGPIHRLTRALTHGMDTGYPLVLISGDAGTGKTALVEQVLRQTGLKSVRVSGRHDRISRQGALQCIFEPLALQMLNEGEAGALEWKDRLLTALGDNAPLILDLVPALEPLIGGLSPTAQLSSFENDVRMTPAIRKWIETIAFTQSPLIIFIDDMQWIDPDILRILECIESSPIKGFFLICAFRDREMAQNHSFARIVQKIRKNHGPILDIHLSCLDRETQAQWISDVFIADRDDIQSFSNALYDKTEGNPFFIRLCLEDLAAQGGLQDDKGSWRWDLSRIQTISMTDPLGDFIAGKISRVDPTAMELLKRAACLGTIFPIRLLAIICENDAETFDISIQSLVDKGILVRDQNYLKFVHDMAREKVYAMMNTAEKQDRHLTCGRLILRETRDHPADTHVALITDQMNAAIERISDPEARLELARLNLKAGRQKLTRASISSADRYFETGLRLLPPDAWASHYELALDLFSKRCETLFLLKRPAEAENAFEQVLRHVEIPDHLLNIFEAKSTYLMQSYQAEEVITSGYLILSRLGYRLPDSFHRFHLRREMVRFTLRMRHRDIQALIHLPEMTHSRDLAILRILVIMVRASVLTGRKTALLFLFKAMNFILKNGIHPHAAYVFAFYGSLLSHWFLDFDTGLAFGRLGMSVVNKFKADRQAFLTHHLNILISMNHQGQTRRHLNEMAALVRRSLNAGRFMNVFNLHVMYFFQLLVSGVRLEDLEQEMMDRQKPILDSNQIVWIHSLDLLFQIIRALRGKSPRYFLLDPPTDPDDESIAAQWEKTRTVPSLSDYFLYRQILAYFLKGPVPSLSFADKGACWFESFVSLSSRMTHRFFHAMALLGLSESDPKQPDRVHRKHLQRHARFFSHIYRKSPENNPHMHFLIQAELAAMNRRGNRAAVLFDRAMSAAGEVGALHLEALCCERAGRFYLALGNRRMGRLLLTEAVRLYEKWGAGPKAESLHRQYADLIQDGSPARGDENGNTMRFQDLDMASIVRISQAISGEIRPHNLMRLLIRQVLETSGAQRAFLFLIRKNQLRLNAFAQVHPRTVKIFQDIPIDKTGSQLARSIVWTAFLSRKPLILDQAATDNRFLYDGYIARNRPLSILCLPMQNQKKRRGILYLENNLLAGAFTRDHLQMLEILMTQIVISMDNSRLYEKLRKVVQKQVRSARKIRIHQVQLRKMASELTRTEERERKAIADDLHDSVTQTLAMGIATLKSMKAAPMGNFLMNKHQIVQMLETSLSGIRSLTFQLSSPLLYDLGLEPALQWLCEDFSGKHDFAVRFVKSELDCAILDDTTKIMLYRSAGELMMNIVKHARARNVLVVVSRTRDELMMMVEDDGVGFEPGILSEPHERTGYGLFSIAERISALKGRVEMDSSPGKGSRIRIFVPISEMSGKSP